MRIYQHNNSLLEILKFKKIYLNSIKTVGQKRVIIFDKRQ